MSETSKFDGYQDFVKMNANLVYSNKVIVDRGWKPSLHTHPHTEIFYITKGYGKLIMKDSEINLKANDFIIINSNLMHTESNIQDRPDLDNLEYIVIGVKGISISEFNKNENDDDIMDYFINKYIFKMSFSNDKNILIELIKNIHKEMTEDSIFSSEYANSLLIILLINILRLNGNDIIIENDFKKNKQLEYIKSYIDSHFSMDLNLDILSKIGYINKYYLIHQFKKLYDITPMDYVNEVRYNTAKDLLINSNLSIQEISSNVGFNSQSYFNQLFKKKSGLTPTRYRSKNK